ncbi:SUMF1/EgtB/PvdO family nonheme iron enzyme [uncultured Thiothrix sp.]|uniref:SUMF1/EgtB/PvdO family nonheme iron enzyme n=1 Tax=uncultured Thiothrix sp. TaxID=223185 RepID=UPI002605AFB9|nr:SUMF1/EgtB/PvdO family nonheme iron enzyme [uncultured Thiothrix sp.]HMT93871.1 SUMF1/EgtB/PvdO family nonheme iron enzyme [Thiolinea sp.]
MSYARDQSHGERLAAETQQQLLAAGFEVFRDVIGLKPGDVWYHKLEFELETSDAVVLIVSEKVRTSKWVHNEISMAQELNLPVIPVFAEKVRSPLWLRHLQALDFCTQTNWVLLIEALASQLSFPSPSSSLSRRIVEKEQPTSNSPSNSGTGDGVKIKPAWASASGTDEYGVYADLTIPFEKKGFLFLKKADVVVQRFRFIEAGTFWMGSPEDEEGRFASETLHQVTLSQSFWLADTACTQVLWQAVMGNNPAYFKTSLQNPVEQVSWNDAQVFIQKLNQQISGIAARLPTEAEWEYACRAGTNSAFGFGGKNDLDTTKANYSGQWDDFNVSGKTVAVKSFAPNPWGLYEMHGNVWEWCEDGYAEYPLQAIIDPRGAPASSARVRRGGSWSNFGWSVRSAYRRSYAPDDRYDDLGFRLALGH